MRTVTLAIIITSLAAATGAAEWHIAVSGDDTNAGSADQPFRTLERARDAIRDAKAADGLPDGGVTVWVHGGVYERAESFTLTAEDGGTPDSPIIYRAVPGEEVRIVGGRRIPADAFKRVDDQAVTQRIPKDARKKVRAADLAALGVKDLGAFPDSFGEAICVPELFFNDARMTLARWPNDDWATIASVIESGRIPNVRWKADKPGTFEYEGDRPARWLDAPAVWLHGYWCFDWRSETIKIAAIDTDKRHITLAKPHGYGLGGGNPAPRRYHAVNLLEELDAPGEYYIDRDSATLYFWPPETLDDNARVVLSTLFDAVIVLDAVDHVTVRGLTIETTVGTGVLVNGGQHDCIAACLIRNMGKDGIIVDGGSQHRVVACDIHDTGTAGLRLKGGDRNTLTPARHEAVNNHIYRVSRRQPTGAYHVHIAGVGNRLAHNLIHHSPHQAIGLAGNDHVIELNEIHHISMETDDCGAFYMGRNPSERGTIIRHNYWHDIGSSYTHGSCAIYFDDGAGGQTVFGNVFYRSSGGHFGAVFSHGGHNNTVENNIFIQCSLALGHAPWTDKHWWEQVAGDTYQRVLLKEVDITKPPYIDRYPELRGFFEPYDEPRVNRAFRNVIAKCDAYVTGNWLLLDNWLADKDPGFINANDRNFGLREDAEVFRRIPDFQPIPFDKMGLYHDEFRPE